MHIWSVTCGLQQKELHATCENLGSFCKELHFLKLFVGKTHLWFPSAFQGSSPIPYDIIMVSLSGSLLLLVVISIAVKVLLR